MTQITEWLITSSTLIVFVFILRAVFAGRVSRRGIYMLWALVAVRLLLPVNLISSPISIMNLFSTPQTASGETDIKQDIGSPTAESGENTFADNVSIYVKPKTEKQQDHQVSDTISDANANTIPETPIQTSEKPAVTMNWTVILFIVWIAGFVSILLMFTVCNILLHYRLTKDRKYVGDFKGLHVYSSHVFRIPCLHGLFRPTIYLPESYIQNIADTDPHRINQILIHEWVHYLHGDSFWSVLRIFLLGAYWFHPLVWASAICSKKDAELACDEKVLWLLGEKERISYGTMLIDMAADMQNRITLYLTTPVSRQGKSLKQRICALEKRNYSKVMSCILIVSVLIMTSATFTGCVYDTGRPSRENNTPASLKNTENTASDPQADMENLYTDFLNEHQSEKEFSYYSVITLGDASCPVLLTTDKTMENTYLAGHAPILVSNTSHLYTIIEKKVTYLGDITCENSDDWLHCSDGKLMSTTQDSVSKQWVEPEEQEIKTETLTDEPDSRGMGGMAGSAANNTSDGEDADTAVSLSDNSFDGEPETPATSTDLPRIKGKVYGYPVNITTTLDEEPETPATSTNGIFDEEDSDSVAYDVTQGDNLGAWLFEFESADSVLFYQNTEDTLTDIVSRKFLMHIVTADYTELSMDITGDGVNDTILMDLNAAKGNYPADEQGNLPPTIQISSGKTGKVIWESDANASLHAGYNQFYLYRKKHKTYLMEWNPACWQGYCSYQWKVFKLTDNGKVKKIAGNKIEFDTNEGRVKEEDFDKIETFGKELNTYLADAELLLDTIPEETLGIPENSKSDEPIRVYRDEQKGESYFDYEAVIRELKTILNK